MQVRSPPKIIVHQFVNLHVTKR